MAVLVTLVAVMGHPDPTLDQHWQLWKKAHGKEYRHQVWGEVGNGGTAAVPGDELRGRVWFQAEEGQRRATWEKNLRLVMLHNLEHSLGLHSYQLGMNHMGDMVRGHCGMGRGKPCRMGCPGRRGGGHHLWRGPRSAALGAVDGGGGSGLGVLEVFSSLDCSVSGSSGMGWGWVVTAVV